MIFENEFSSILKEDLSIKEDRSRGAFIEFIDILGANLYTRSFEMGLCSSVDICCEFGYDRETKLSSGIIS